ncbi:2OG-Fe dioxygenase family protein [Streptomyces sp. NPDC050546]|uniref:2OG-Fe dioxygenase family protein n=1 Tax=Streptomyces sp. NPDC050546 TaxID=3365628 RepID=UPI0037B965B6
MTTTPLTSTPLTAPSDGESGDLGPRLFREGYAVLRGKRPGDGTPAAELASFQALWDDLVLDENLTGGNTYRFRRYGRVWGVTTADGAEFTPLPHTAFQQSAEHIPIHMGRARLFEPIAPEHLLHPVLHRLLADDLRLIAAGDDRREWEIGLHMVRTVAGETPGLPTPEGRHRDGHDYIGMHLMNRRDCTGGESIVYREGLPDTRLTLTDPLDGMVVIDAAIMHEVTPIAATTGQGVRDMLLVDYNARENRP